MISKKNYKEKETLVERGTKRFQERLAEEKEAEQEIKHYDHIPDMYDHDDFDTREDGRVKPFE